MFRRSPRSPSPFRHRQEELARQESELRESVEKLERSIAAAPRVAEETARRQREEFLMRAKTGGNRLDVSIAQDKRYGDDGGSTRRRGSLRKERREGRIMFLMLVIALAGAVIWLVSHLHF